MSTTPQIFPPVAPGGTIGILGGGQLGRMLTMAAARLGLRVHIYCDTANAPAFAVCAAQTHAAYDDETSLAAFAEACDAITYEFENVPAATAAFLANLKPTHPNARSLAVAQDRLAEKTFLRSLGLHTAPFAAVTSEDEARAAFAQIGTPAILKTSRLGYDGKGQRDIASADECVDAFKNFNCAACVLEGFVAFDFEASVIAARGADGAFAAYDPPENHHESHILRRSSVPGRLTTKQGDAAKAIARRIADALDYIGVLAVELFVCGDEILLVNEIAPRVHNSGHWTLEACAVSQFEQHIRAVAGWPLGNPQRHSDAVMQNILGEEAADWQGLAKRDGALHLYGKNDIRPGRKMGHFTSVSPKT